MWETCTIVVSIQQNYFVFHSAFPSDSSFSNPSCNPFQSYKSNGCFLRHTYQRVVVGLTLQLSETDYWWSKYTLLYINGKLWFGISKYCKIKYAHKWRWLIIASWLFIGLGKQHVDIILFIYVSKLWDDNISYS